MHDQFIEIESHARIERISKYGRLTPSIKQAIAYAERTPGIFSYTSESELPKLIFGCAPTKLEELAEDWASESNDEKGQEIKDYAFILMSGTVLSPTDSFMGYNKKILKTKPLQIVNKNVNL